MHCNFASLLVAAFLALPPSLNPMRSLSILRPPTSKTSWKWRLLNWPNFEIGLLLKPFPLVGELSALETELQEVRSEYDSTVRLLDGRTLDLTNLAADIKSRNDEASYLNNLLSEFIRNFEPRLHIAEVQRYGDRIEAARIAPESSNLTPAEIYAEQIKILDLALERLEDSFGGTRHRHGRR